MNLALVEQLERESASRLRLRAALEAGLSALAPALILGAGVAMAMEMAVGLSPSHLPLVWLPLSWPLLASLRAWLSPLSPTAALKALDDAAVLEDRLGTALALQAGEGVLLSRQREDALAHAQGLNPRALFPLGKGVYPRRILVPALLFLASSSLCLAFDLTPDRTVAEAPPTPLEESADRLLARLEALENSPEAARNKGLAATLTDLRQQVEAIREREKRLRTSPKKAEPPRASLEAPKAVVPPPEGDLATPEQLEKLHQRLERELEAAFSQDSNKARAAIADAVNKAGVKELDRIFDKLEAASSAQNSQMFSAPPAQMVPAQNALSSHGLTAPPGGMGMGSGSSFAGMPPGGGGQQGMAPNQKPGLSPNSPAGKTALREVPMQAPEDPTQQASALQSQINSEFDRMKQELAKGKDKFEGHEQQHNVSESFQQFLKDYTFRRTQQLSDFLTGGKKKKPPQSGPKPKVVPGESGGKPMANKEISGFKEQEEKPPPVQGDSGEAAPEGAKSAPMPEGLMAEAGGPPQAAAPGSATGQGEGTAEGGQGAGRGDGIEPEGEGGGSPLLPPGATAELERVLGQTSRDGGLTPEERRRVFDQVANHKVSGGLNTEDLGPALGGYFQEADLQLADAGEELPPLFREYVRGYFAAIRGRNGEGSPPASSGNDRDAGTTQR